MKVTYMVLPAESDIQGQLRIVSRETDDHICLSLRDYRDRPDLWQDAGLVAAYEGRLVCIDALPSEAEDIRSCEPLRPPLTFAYVRS